MEVLKSEFHFGKIIDSASAFLDTDKAQLWVWHADKIPPHIGFSINSHYFSLKANGRDVNVPIDSIIAVIHKKKIPTLAIQLDINIENSSVEEEFFRYSKTVPQQITCLEPIKQILGSTESSQLTELLTVLKDRNQLQQVTGFYLPEDFRQISSYTLEDIHRRLSDLVNKT
jgi:hypothetical protein